MSRALHAHFHCTTQREVGAIQNKLSSMENDQVMETYDRKSMEKRMFIRYELRRLMKRSLSELRGEIGFNFSSMFRRCPLEFSVLCSLQDFSILCSDLNNKITEGVRYLPSLTTITSQIHPLSEKHVVFDKYETLLQWIGVASAEEMSGFLHHQVTRKQNHHLQVMGGAHWPLDDTTRPLNVFFGASCSRSIEGVKRDNVINAIASDVIEIVPSSTVFTSPDQKTCLSLPSTEWDCNNGTFKNDFRLSQGSANVNLISFSNIMDFDAFTLTWRPLPGLRSHDIPAINGERIVLGNLVVFIPAVVFTGQALCKLVKSLLEL